MDGCEGDKKRGRGERGRAVGGWESRSPISRAGNSHFPICVILHLGKLSLGGQIDDSSEVFELLNSRVRISTHVFSTLPDGVGIKEWKQLTSSPRVTTGIKGPGCLKGGTNSYP